MDWTDHPQSLVKTPYGCRIIKSVNTNYSYILPEIHFRKESAIHVEDIRNPGSLYKHTYKGVRQRRDFQVGVYIFHEVTNNVSIPIYVGYSGDLARRIREHLCRDGKIYSYQRKIWEEKSCFVEFNVRLFVVYDSADNIEMSYSERDEIAYANEITLIKYLSPMLNIIHNPHNACA